LKICVEPMPRPSSFAMVPLGVDEWFAQIVNRDPAQRFRTARDAAEALRVVCAGDARPYTLPVPAAPQGFGAPHEAQHGSTEAPVSRSANELGHRVPMEKSGGFLLLAGGVVAIAALGGALFLLKSPAKRTKEPLAASSRSPQVPAAETPAVPKVVPVVCEANARQCLGTTPQSCVAGQWTAGPVTAGECGATCTPGSAPARCSGGIPQICDPSGDWRANAACSNSQECRDGECIAKKPVPLVASPPARPPIAAPATKSNCVPPYTLDSQGHKHFKPECYR